MPHIHQEENQYDHTVSAFIVLIEEGKKDRVLLHRHRKLGLWFQPGGHVELNENPYQAIAHELQEETGFDLNDLALLEPRTLRLPQGIQETLHPLPLFSRSHYYIGSDPTHYHHDLTYGFVTDKKPQGKPAEGESQELHWFTREELAEIPSGDIHPDIRTIAHDILDGHHDLSVRAASDYSLEIPAPLVF